MLFFEFYIAICHKLIYAYYSTFTKWEDHKGRSIDKSRILISLSKDRYLRISARSGIK